MGKTHDLGPQLRAEGEGRLHARSISPSVFHLYQNLRLCMCYAGVNHGSHVPAVTGSSTVNHGSHVPAVTGSDNINHGSHVPAVTGSSNVNHGSHVPAVTGSEY